MALGKHAKFHMQYQFIYYILYINDIDYMHNCISFHYIYTNTQVNLVQNNFQY